MSEEIKESYLKLPNVTVGELQDVVDFMEDNNIEYVEFYEKDLKQQIVHLQQKVEQLEKENDKLKHKLNDIAFGDDSELALRFLRKIDYVDFDEKRKVYINKHNNEPFLWKDEQEKDYYLKDEELNEYTQQLEYKLEQLENIRKEAIEEIQRVLDIWTNKPNEIATLDLEYLLNILNKGGISKYE